MRKHFGFLFYYVMGFIVLLSACTKDTIDDEYPVIDMLGITAFPNNCDTIYTGQTFVFRAIFSDNIELGAFSLDIHHNFDHHSHSTSDEACDLWPIKEAENPFLYIKEFEIPDGLTDYTAEQIISVPAGVDNGDYHLSVRLTDRVGWQETVGISIKILTME